MTPFTHSLTSQPNFIDIIRASVERMKPGTQQESNPEPSELKFLAVPLDGPTLPLAWPHNVTCPALPFPSFHVCSISNLTALIRKCEIPTPTPTPPKKLDEQDFKSFLYLPKKLYELFVSAVFVAL